MHLHIEQHNESFVQLRGDMSVIHELRDVFTFTVPNYKFMPKYRDGVWDGTIKLLNIHNGQLPKGLVPDALDVLHDKGYSVSVDPEIIKPFKEQYDFDWNSLKLDFEPYDFQCEAVDICLNKKRQIIISSTGSGKSLIIYAICRKMMELGHRVLLVVPSISLVEQMASDFDDYGKNDETWPGSKEVVAKIYGGQDKNPAPTVDIDLADGSQIRLRGNQSIKTINRGSINALELSETDEIDDEWLTSIREHHSR